MYPPSPSSSTLNHRPRGFSQHEPADAPSLLPHFLRRLSSPRAPAPYDRVDRVEKIGNGSAAAYANGGQVRSQSVSFVSSSAFAMRSRIWKVFVCILVVLAVLYFFLPWAPSSFAPLST